jgi:oligosaccharide repeat unit polymerase
MTNSRTEIVFLAIATNFFICLVAIMARQWLVDEHITIVLVTQSIGILSLIVIHSYTWSRIGGNDLSLAFIFFLMVFIFNLGKSVLFVFYYHEGASFFSFFTEFDLQVIVRAFEYGYVGFFVLSSAMLFSHKREPRQLMELTQEQVSAARFTGLLFLTFSLPASLLDLKTMIVQVLSGGYFALFNGEQSYGAAGIIKVLTFFLYPSLLLLIAAYSKNKKILNLIFIFALSIALIKMALGMRLASLIPFIIFLSLWDSVIKPLNRKSIYMVVIFMFVVVFPAMSFLRTGQEISEDIEKTSAIYRIIEEMSDSISPLIWVMQRVPSQMEFQYGHSFLLAISTIIPNLFWDIHPAKSGSLALWLVHEVNPWIAERGGGYGFSIFAELYLNFYWFGMFVLFLLGILINKLAMIKNNIVNTAFAFSCFLGFMLWPRGELVTVARFIFWNVGFLWVTYHIMVAAYSKMK